MPIYAYKCASCGHALDVLQKMSDAVLTDCPSCAAPALKKQVTAAGFQLKGSGWYVTDFRNGSTAAATPKAEDGKPAETKPAADSTVAKPADTSATPAAAPAPAPAPAAAPSGGSSSAA